MPPTSRVERRNLQSLDRAALGQYQLARLNGLLDTVLPDNGFYAAKLAGVPRPIESLEALRELPLTTKAELVESGDCRAANHTFKVDRYSRLHQTSGTRGRPIIVMDTADDWNRWIDVWQYVLDAADVLPIDRAVMAFSFGPFIGFWSAYDAVAQRGCLVAPSGGMSSLARLELIRTSQANLLFCTPSYALHLLEIAGEHGINVPALGIRKIIVAGEPGGSIPAIRARIEQGWQAALIDHAGATEVGPWGFGDRAGRGLHIIESEFIAEFISIETGRVLTDFSTNRGPASDDTSSSGELSELVLTNLGREGCPVIRYRTGDLVRPRWNLNGVHDETNHFVFLEGGVLGRTDDMMVIRGVNIFPSSVEQIVRSFPEVVEYRLTVHKVAAMDQLTVEIEDSLQNAQRVADALQVRLGLKVRVELVPLGSLPRGEGKGKRFVDRR